MVMVRERERIVDYGLVYVMGKFVGPKARLKSIIPHGDICKGKISFYIVLQVVSFSII